jgi:hypothetical protein
VDAQAIVENYISDVEAGLPRKLREHVGSELRGLLAWQLSEAAADAGRALDGAIALEVVRRFGRPEEVAARYTPRGFQIIEPEHARAFVILAAGCVAAQWAITLPQLYLSSMTVGGWWLSWGHTALAWVGWLVVWFGIAGWIRRRSALEPDAASLRWAHWVFWLPNPRAWRPVDRQKAGRRPVTFALPLSAALTLFFMAPSWFLEHFLPAGTSTSWASYGNDFRRWLLLPLIVLMSLRLGLFAAVVVNDRWWQPTRGVRFGLWIGFVGLLYWAAFGWDIFAARPVDLAFKAWLSIFLFINTLQIGASLIHSRRRQIAANVKRAVE